MSRANCSKFAHKTLIASRNNIMQSIIISKGQDMQKLHHKDDANRDLMQPYESAHAH